MRRTTASAAPATRRTEIRPPAVPLVTIDPYFSIWSCADKLTDEHTKHWTGAQHPLVGMLRVDGRCLRFLGHVHGVEAMEQQSVEVLPTRTIYVFLTRGVELTLTFTTPALPDDLDTYSWPLSYVSEPADRWWRPRRGLPPTDGADSVWRLWPSISSRSAKPTWSRCAWATRAC